MDPKGKMCISLQNVDQTTGQTKVPHYLNHPKMDRSNFGLISGRGILNMKIVGGKVEIKSRLRLSSHTAFQR